MSTYTATHAGQTFTRKSSRIYTHVVIARRNIDYDMVLVQEAAEARTKAFLSSYSFCFQEANDKTRQFSYPHDQLKSIQKAASMTEEEVRAVWVSIGLTDIEVSKQSGYYEKFRVIRWTGSQYLAAEVAKRSSGHPWNKDVTIVEVEAA